MLRRIRSERGIALVAAVGIMMVLSMTTVTVIAYSASNERHAGRSSSGQVSFSLAEAGVNNALSILSHDNSDALDPATLTPPGGNTCPDGSACWRHEYEGGHVLWRGAFDAATNRWTIYAWGVAPHPTAPQVRDYLEARISVIANPNQPLNATAWNYVVAWQTSNATTCDVTMTQTAHVDAPFYVAGNLCLRNSSKVYQPDDANPVQLVVKGKLEVMQGTTATKAKVGDSSAPADWIDRAEIVGGCTTDITQAAHTCDPASPTLDRVWATTLTNSGSTTVEKPTADFAGWYDNADPGPKNPCDPASARPLFDNDTTLDLATNGSAGTVDLTPATSYSCIGKDASGFKTGEITWDATAKMLTISGAMYIDGSVVVDDDTLIKYQGHATLYLTGTFSLVGGQTRLCAAWTGTDCDFASWDPNQHMLIVVTNGKDASGNGVVFSQAVQFQGGLFAEHAIDLGQSSRSEGPMIAKTVKLGQAVTIKPLPLIETLPLGAPGNPNTHATPQRPIYIKR